MRSHQVPVIQIKSLNKEYASPEGKVAILNNIDLAVYPAEYLAIVGKSGSGKSTLLNMLTGIDHPTTGSVQIAGTNLGQMNENEMAQWRGKNIGIVFQFFQLLPTLTILENIVIAMDFVGIVPKLERKNRAISLLDDVGLSKHHNKFPSQLSGGEQQRAAIARALANDPQIIVADEPTGNLDSKNAESVRGIFDRLIEKGKTVIVVTHEDVSRFSFSRILSIQDGQIVKDDRQDDRQNDHQNDKRK